MKHHPAYKNLHKEAKQLRKKVVAGEEEALDVIRKAFPISHPRNKEYLIEWSTLMRCQHSYARVRGYKKWEHMLEEHMKEWEATQ